MVKNLAVVQETWVQSLGQEDSLQKEMATHSNILAWRIPWTEELGSPWGHKESDRTETTARTHGDSVVKIFPANARDVGSVPGSGRFPAEGNDNLLQYSCLENLLDIGAWGVMVHGVTKVLYMT